MFEIFASFLERFHRSFVPEMPASQVILIASGLTVRDWASLAFSGAVIFTRI